MLANVILRAQLEVVGSSDSRQTRQISFKCLESQTLQDRSKRLLRHHINNHRSSKVANGPIELVNPSKAYRNRIPLNDDKKEKAVRLQSRQALHDLQMNSLKAAASPMRKLNTYQRAVSDSPTTSGARTTEGKENVEDGGLAVITNGVMTPMKRVPLLANFEEWMKMATDNKINATNSWNFALIDYFHDMSLLKEGDGVNFQKASCTLDGCVKIYTSRVDSVATETGKLLSGLADSGNKKSNKDDVAGEAGDEGDEEGEENEDGTKKRPRKKVCWPHALVSRDSPAVGPTCFGSHFGIFVCLATAEEI